MPVNMAWFTWSLQPGFSQYNSDSFLLPLFNSEHKEINDAYHFPWFPIFPSLPSADPNIKIHQADYAEFHIKIFLHLSVQQNEHVI